jgi:hypothetical protein
MRVCFTWNGCVDSDSVRYDVPVRSALISRELWILEEDAQVVMTFAGQEARKERHSGVDFSGGKEYGNSGIWMHALKNCRRIGGVRTVRNQLVSAGRATNQ